MNNLVVKKFLISLSQSELGCFFFKSTVTSGIFPRFHILGLRLVQCISSLIPLVLLDCAL